MQQRLINRWKSQEGKYLLSEVLSKLSCNKSLDTIKGLEKYAGRWDLRGAPLSTLKSERKIEGEGTSFTQKYGSLKLKNIHVESIDFSYADISYSWWQQCRVNNCIFEGTKAKELQIYASDFFNCTFRNTSFNYSFLNNNLGKNSGSYKRVNFIECDLKECIFSFPEIENCIFENCNLMATNFDGSRFKHCKFIGKVDSPWFSGYSTTAQKSIFWIFNRVNPKDYPNLMQNVDFSEADLIGVSFINEIDLSQCVFPKDDEKYIVVRNLKKVYHTVERLMREKWDTNELRKGVSLLNNLYFTKDRQNQNIDFIDKKIMVFSDEKSDFGEKFFSLIKETNKKVNS
ncbi:hypothetical protein GCM10011506_18900 [Marivirga lumbricoides]|uniref:Pentapeptide repeat-containing protein n=1 Tax=Marivirga lumbricoides TaxID=1046115 RepID=A0ABQ1M6Q8_9BACT|nr:hypothetical protein GCM10011506_18900 [Marivirga lumbricoides]